MPSRSRLLPTAALALAVLVPTGCAATWDTLTSRRFREHPFQTTWNLLAPEDPVVVLRSDPPRDPDEQAAALRRLKEPLRNGGTADDQEAILDVLARAATTDPSPVLRMEAITALGRFTDPRAAGILIAAYQSAHGRREGEPATRPVPEPGVIPAGGRAGRASNSGLTDRFPITGPTGFPPEWVRAIRCRAAESLGNTNRPEAAKFLATVAGGSDPDTVAEGHEDRDVRLAAIRGLARCRQPEAVVALAQVLQNQAASKDTAAIGRAHEGLVRLTGKRLPPDPQAWREVVQAGVVVVPEPSWFEKVIDQAIFWERK